MPRATRRHTPSRLRTFRLALAAAIGAIVLGSSLVTPSTALAATATFAYTNSSQQFVVPSGVTSIDVVVRGAAGETMNVNGTAGAGAEVSATLTVTPGETLQIEVGGQGMGAQGGYNGGGDSGTGGFFLAGGGGGASDIRRGACAATASCGFGDRVVVAGGGGGQESGGFSAPSDGGNGGLTGGDGSDPDALGIFGVGATGGSGGAGGGNGNAGGLGVGGDGGTAGDPGAGAGAGGGGGLYGGGGGGGGDAFDPTAGNAGGGSSTGPVGSIYVTGAETGHGSVAISYTPVNVATTTTLSSSSGASPTVYGEPVVFSAAVAPSPGAGAGDVLFTVGGVPAPPPVPVDASGAADSVPFVDLAVGLVNVVADYSGDGLVHDPSTSTPYVHTVVAAATSTAVTASQATVTEGDPVTFTATVDALAPSVAAVDGTVTFTRSATPIPGCANVAIVAGDAICTTSAIPAGTATVTATLDASTNFTTSADSVSVTITPTAPPTTTTTTTTTSTTTTTTTTAPTTTSVTTSPTTTIPAAPAPATTAPATTAPAATTPPATTTTSLAPSTTRPPATTPAAPSPLVTPTTVADAPVSVTSTTAVAPLDDPAPSTTVEPSSTTTTPPATPTTAPTAGPRAIADVVFSFSTGDPAAGGTAVVEGEGFLPGSDVTVTMYSTPTELARIDTDDGGAFSTTVTLPDDVEPGDHRFVVDGFDTVGEPASRTWFLQVAADGTVTELEATPGITPEWFDPDRIIYAPYDVEAHAPVVVAAMVSGFALLTLSTLTTGIDLTPSSSGAGGVALAGGAAGGSMAEASRRRKASLGSVSGKHVAADVDDLEIGDRSFTWRFPFGRHRVDTASTALPVRVAPVSPLLGRIIADGAMSRAMFGSLSLLAPVVGVVLGLIAAADTGWQPFPPATWIVLAIIAVGVFDASAGLTAAAVWFTAVTIGSDTWSADTVRFMLGMALVMFAVGVVATKARPLRRPPAAGAAERFDRFADVAIVALLGAWGTQKLVGALPALGALDYDIAGDANLIAIVAGACLFARMTAETAAVRWYPLRLDEVCPPKLPKPGTRQRAIVIAVQTVLMWFIAVAWLGNIWELYVGCALFAVPQYVGLVQDRLPNSPALAKWAPSGVAKTVLMIVIGTYFAAFVSRLFDDPAQFITVGFVVLTIPGLVLSIASWFGRDGARPALTWAGRIAGVVVIAIGFSIVQGHIQLL